MGWNSSKSISFGMTYTALDDDTIGQIAQQASSKNYKPAEDGRLTSQVHRPQKVIAAIANDHGYFPLRASDDSHIAVMGVY
jgi:hypothetical protein